MKKRDSEREDDTLALCRARAEAAAAIADEAALAAAVIAAEPEVNY